MVMRIVAKIASAGTGGVSRFPVLNASIDECLGPDGHLDPALVRKSLDLEQVQFGSKDDLRVMAFAMEYLTLQRSIVERLAAQIEKGGECAATVADVPTHRQEPVVPSDQRSERRLNRGRVVYVRTDITGCADGIHAKLSVQNPKGVVGHSESFARDYALMCARMLNYLKDNIKTSEIVLIEGEGVAGIYDEARNRDREDELSRRRATCHRRILGGFCSPSDPSCPLFKNGRCIEH